MGISADLAVHYVRTGWLQRLGRGIYRRPGEPLQLHPSLAVLQQQIRGFHVGGKTALEWYGRHSAGREAEFRDFPEALGGLLVGLEGHAQQLEERALEL